MTETETVRAFFDALVSMEAERVLAFAADDIVYENVSLPKADGKRAFEQQMRGFARLFDRFEVEFLHVAQRDDVVLTERVDALGRGGYLMKFWVCGTLRVRDEKIVLWRDYFDWLNLSAGALRGVRGLFRR
ncbi:MAG: nuclear transport factor 2 family protein [Polyangiaceae bacterium]|nr:nuclear transport factor 2 family protein [Polyangiaceae bacterium]